MRMLSNQHNIPWNSRIRSSRLPRPSSRTRLGRRKRRRRTIMQPSQNLSVVPTPIMLRNQCLPNYKMNLTHHCQHFHFQQWLISQTLQLHSTHACMSRSTFECFGRQYLTSVGPRGNALAVDRMTQSKLWKGSLPVLHMYSSQYG